MAALQCEICGGKLMGRAGGIFECDSCGMQYDKTRVQEMVQEIKGTVKVEGTVEVKGTVKLEGPFKVEGMPAQGKYLKRGWILLNDARWAQADECFDKALDCDPECGEAYAGKLCAQLHFRDLLEISYSRNHGQSIETNPMFRNALLFGDEELRERLEDYLDTRKKLYDYRRACELLKECDSVEKLEEAKRLIDKSGDLSKEQDMLARCDEAIARLNTEKNNGFVYRQACAAMKQESIKGWKAAIPLFEKLGDWKDSKQLAAKCAKNIERQKRNDRLYSEELQLMKEMQGLSIFSKKRRKEIEDRLAEIEKELKGLR